jgi:hypothetical protein
MLVHKIALAAVALATMVVAVPSAAAASFITDELGTHPSAITSNASDPATLQMTLEGLSADISCNRTTLSVSVGAGGGATIAGTLNSLSLENCTDSFPVITFTACSLSGSTPTATLTAGAGGGSMTLAATVLFCAVAGSTSGCYYRAADATGSFQNVTNSVQYANVAITHVTGTGDLGSLCGTSGSFGVTLTQMVNAANNSPVTLLTAP